MGFLRCFHDPGTPATFHNTHRHTHKNTRKLKQNTFTQKHTTVRGVGGPRHVVALVAKVKDDGAYFVFLWNTFKSSMSMDKHVPEFISVKEGNCLSDDLSSLFDCFGLILFERPKW